MKDMWFITSDYLFYSDSSSVSKRDKESALLCFIPGLWTGVKVYCCNSSTQLSTIYYRVLRFSGALYYSSKATAALLSITSLNGACKMYCRNFLVAQYTARISPLYAG